MDNKTISLISVCMVLCVLCVTVAVVYINYKNTQLRNTATIKTANLEIFSDQSCTVELTEINWGTIYTDIEYNTTAYIRVVGNMPLIVRMTYGNFTFTSVTNETVPTNTSSHCILTWTGEDVMIHPQDVFEVKFVFKVTSGIAWHIGTFTFTINITGYAEMMS